MDHKVTPSLEELSRKLAALEKENEALKSRISSLENKQTKPREKHRAEETEVDTLRYGYLTSVGFTSHLERDLRRPELVQALLRDFYSIYGLEKTKKAFPDSLQGSFGVLRSAKEIEAMGYALKDVTSGSHRRYFAEPFCYDKDEPIYLCSQWKGTIEEGLRRSDEGKSTSNCNFYSLIARACGMFDYQIFAGDKTYGKEDFDMEDFETMPLEPWTMALGESYPKNVDVIAKFGPHYRGWQKGSWPYDKPAIPFVLCFIKPEKKDTGWINVFPSEDVWEQHSPNRPGQAMIDDTLSGRIRLLFIYKEKPARYIFRGIYVMQAPYAPYHNTFKRIAQSVSFAPETGILTYTTADQKKHSLSLSNL